MEKIYIWGEGVFHTHYMIYGQYDERPWKSAPAIILDENLSLILSNEPS